MRKPPNEGDRLQRFGRRDDRCKRDAVWRGVLDRSEAQVGLEDAGGGPRVSNTWSGADRLQGLGRDQALPHRGGHRAALDFEVRPPVDVEAGVKSAASSAISAWNWMRVRAPVDCVRRRHRW